MYSLFRVLLLVLKSVSTILYWTLPLKVIFPREKIIQSTTLQLCSRPVDLSPSSAYNDDFPARLDSSTNIVFDTYFQCSSKIFGDSAGRLIAPSISGNNYILVVYCYDNNTIHPISMPSTTKESQIVAYSTVTFLLKNRGFSPKLATLDNVTSELLLQSLENDDIAINLVPHRIHRRNAAE